MNELETSLIRLFPERGACLCSAQPTRRAPGFTKPPTTVQRPKPEPQQRPSAFHPNGPQVSAASARILLLGQPQLRAPDLLQLLQPVPVREQDEPQPLSQQPDPAAVQVTGAERTHGTGASARDSLLTVISPSGRGQAGTQVWGHFYFGPGSTVHSSALHFGSFRRRHSHEACHSFCQSQKTSALTGYVQLHKDSRQFSYCKSITSYSFIPAFLLTMSPQQRGLFH